MRHSFGGKVNAGTKPGIIIRNFFLIFVRFSVLLSFSTFFVNGIEKFIK